MSKQRKRKITKKQIKEAEALNEQIEDLELHNMSQTEIEKTVKTFSKEGMQLRRARKEVRYQLYRLRSEAQGISTSNSTSEFRKIFEDQVGFEGWRMFGTTWDVAFEDPFRIVHKTISEQEEWDEIVRAKFPTIDHNGNVSYPDINVRRRVEKYLEENKD